MQAAESAKLAALLLAVAGHAGAAFIISASDAPAAPAPASLDRGKVVVVRLGETASFRGRQAVPSENVAERVVGRARNEEALLPIVQPNGPHYFRVSELTQRPEVLQDAVADLIIRMPGLEPQPVVLRLLISDEGQVDQVLIEDSFLAAEVERAITEAFSRIRFEPGKIGRIAVRSQMRVEVRLETMEHRLSG